MRKGKRKIYIAIAAVLLLAAAAWLLSRKGGAVQGRYNMTRVERGDLEAVVSSTGTLDAVTTVEVGTQVSGRIAKIYADFNQHVKQGDLIAMLDTSSLQMAVSEAESSYEKAKAQLKQAKQDLDRTQYLFKESIKTQNDLEQAQVSHELAVASMKSAQSSLERSRINLGYASIYAPIDGIITSRAIEVGQTVAASFSSPTLFKIANDLKKMQILALVDEGDIGQIKGGQDVRFTVQAFPNRKFSGTVSQVRLEPTTTNNVVNYTVVINVANDDGQLMPGMTATIDFIVGQAKDVLLVASAALRIKPSEEMIAVLKKQFAERMAARGGAAPAGAAGMPQGAGGPSAMGAGGFPGFNRNGNGNGRPKDIALVWYLDGSGQLKAARVRTGITDGQQTEVRSDELKEGMEVIKTVNLTPEEQAGGGPRFRIL
jgi:HlyD family secretion protein